MLIFFCSYRIGMTRQCHFFNMLTCIHISVRLGWLGFILCPVSYQSLERCGEFFHRDRETVGQCGESPAVPQYTLRKTPRITTGKDSCQS